MTCQVIVGGEILPGMEIVDTRYVKSQLGVAKEWAEQNPLEFAFPIFDALDVQIVNAANSTREQEIIATRMEGDFLIVEFAWWGPHNGLEFYIRRE